MYVYQCPECDLKFQFASELQQHLALDHPNFVATPQTIEDALTSTTHRRHVPRIHSDEP